MPDFDDLDPDFPPEEEHDYDKPVAELEEGLTKQDRVVLRFGTFFHSRIK